jgi:plastocyanin
MGMRRVGVMLAVVALLGAGCGDDDSGDDSASATTAPASVSGPQQYTVAVDGPSVLGAENLAYATYFPNRLAVRPGDSVLFDNRSSNDVHTVTLGVKSDRSDQPFELLKSGQANPAVFAPCYTTEAARPDISCPPPTSGAPEYTGQGFWNSGVILPTSLPPEAGSKTATVKLAAEIPPAAYTITCLLHPYMEATLDVVASDEARRSPAEVAAAGDAELAAAKTHAATVPVPAPPAATNGASVVAGWSDEQVAVNRFHPETVSVKAGQTVAWRGVSTWMPHTVSFQAPFRGPAEPDALLPTGTKSGGRFDGGVSHSGIFGPPPNYPFETFSLTFTKAGQYPYLCLLHPGMAGTVRVE